MLGYFISYYFFLSALQIGMRDTSNQNNSGHYFQKPKLQWQEWV